jgi:putative transposase
MKKSRFTESQIVAILKEADAGLPVGDMIRKHRISSASYYNWKAKYGGLDASELKRIKELEGQPLIAPTEKNITWALDFMHETLYSGKPFRTLNIIDESNREILAIEIDTSLPAGRVIRTLEQLGEIYGLPQAIRLDNGPELRSAVMTKWCEDKGIELRYIQPGKPSQNAFIERFNRTYRHEVLNAYLFEDLDQVREITDDWITVYNEERPHGALGKLPPRLFRQQAENSTSSLST